MHNFVKKATANLIKKVKIHLIYYNIIKICLPYKKHTCNSFQADSIPYMVVMNKNFQTCELTALTEFGEEKIQILL